MTIRKALFWVHLGAGLTAGVIIAIMCVTGAALAFEKQIVAWAERDARLVNQPDPGAQRLSLDEIRARFAQAFPDRRPWALIVTNDARAAVAINVGRDETFYANPYDGSLRQAGSTRVREFMREANEWHRGLARAGSGRAAGQAVTGACNLAFLFLGLSGAILWWPRKWRTKGLRRSLWFLRNATGRARAWNWHNVIGFWCLPVLLVLTASGVVLSYRWAGDLVYRSFGEAPPVPGNSPRADAGPKKISPPASDSHPLTLASLAALAQREFPDWNSLTVYLGDSPRKENDGRAFPALVAVKDARAWPRTATSNLYLDPFSGAVLKREDFADFTPGRRARTWLRFLHTGEALGLLGQFVAGLACIGGCFLVYTGFALAWRRFRGEKKIGSAVEPSGLG